MSDRILFVCTGNTCRSPMAAAAFQHICAPAGIDDLEVDAAGLHAVEGAAVHPHARRLLADMKIPLLRLQSRQLGAKLVKRSDLIVTMTADQRDAIREQYPLARLKTVPLMAFSDDGPAGVPDPVGADLEGYRECLALMLPALRQMAADRYGLD